MSALDIAEPQGCAERFDRAGRRRDRAPLLQPDVPFGADAGEAGDLFPQQPSRSARALHRQADALRPELRPT